jgi:hypothetical protein
VVPPLRPTLDPHAPTLVAVFALPDVAGTRSLVRDLPPLVHRRPVPPVRPVPSGRVTGIVDVAEPVPDRAESVRAELIPVDEPGSVEVSEQLVLPRPRYTALPASTPTLALTEARAEYVAEPVAPEQPFRGVTEIERLAARYEEMGLANAMGMLGMADGPSVAVPPPASAPEPEPARPSTPTQPQRPNLAQSRRLGLRVSRNEPEADPPAPVPAEPEPESVPSVEPGPVTPVAVVVEPVVTEQAEPSPLPHRKQLPPVAPPTTVDEPPAERPLVQSTPQRTVAAPLWPRPRAKAHTPVSEPAPPPERAAAEPPKQAPEQQNPEQPLPVAVAPEPEPAVPTPVHEEPLVHRRSTPDVPAPSAVPSPEGSPSEEPSDEPLPVISGPVYRAVLDDRAPVPPAPTGATSGPVMVPVPDELTVLFRQELGVDITPIPVHRGRAVTQRAAELGARAFTHGGEVFLPDRAGPLTERPVRALLAHELAHAVQQRVLGPAQPSPESADGRELEEAAHAVEQWVAGDGAAPRSLVHRSAGPVSSTPTFLPAAVTQLAEGSRLAEAIRFAQGTAVAEPPTAQPAMRPSLPTSWSLRDGFASEPTPAAEPASAADPTTIAEQPPATPAATSGSGSGPAFPWIAPRSAEPDHEVGRAVATAFQQIADLRDSVAGLRARQDAPEQPRTVDLSEVAGRIYEYVRSRLRAELIVDRERAGLLADIG